MHLSSPTTEELTLEDISPKWAMRLKSENMPSFMSLTWLRWRHELQKQSKCVVGEAYGYSPHYTQNCAECEEIGCKFLYYFMSNRRKKLEQNKQEFVKHWNEEHSQKQRISAKWLFSATMKFNFLVQDTNVLNAERNLKTRLS